MQQQFTFETDPIPKMRFDAVEHSHPLENRYIKPNARPALSA
jgi:hypothetical protein